MNGEQNHFPGETPVHGNWQRPQQRWVSLYEVESPGPDLSRARLRTAARQRVTFLRELALSGSVSLAAIRCGVDRRALYRWRNRDAAFRARWDKLLAAREEMLMDEAFKLARTGLPRYFVRGGMPLGVTRVPDAKLIMFLLRRLRAKPSGAEAG